MKRLSVKLVAKSRGTAVQHPELIVRSIVQTSPATAPLNTLRRWHQLRQLVISGMKRMCHDVAHPLFSWPGVMQTLRESVRPARKQHENERVPRCRKPAPARRGRAGRYSTRAQNSFSVTSKKSYGRLSYERQTGNDQSSYLVPSSDFSSRYQLPLRSIPHTLSVSKSFVNRKKSILETASRNSSRVSNEANTVSLCVQQIRAKIKYKVLSNQLHPCGCRGPNPPSCAGGRIRPEA